VLTPRAVAERLGVSLATVYSLLSSGRLHAYRIGVGRGTYRVSEDQLASFLRGAEPTIVPPPVPPRKARLKHLKVS
jgi:excisionase family DNA binding protein